MPEIINAKVNVFRGLNNMLNPASAEYREGMAYRAKNARINAKGLWTARPKLIASSIEPAHIEAWRDGAPGPHYRCLDVEDTISIIDGLNTTDVMDIGVNKILYVTTGSDTVQRKTSGSDAFADVAVPEVPYIDSPPTQTSSGGAGRAELGTYHYIFTSYNPTYEVESVPTTAYMVTLNDANEHITMTLSDNAAGDKVRVYRCRRTSATDNVWNATNIFYFLTELTGDEKVYADKLHDNEMNIEYDGRGSIPPDGVDYLVSFQNRMLYFVGNILYWSSPGRPQEVAQEYSVTIQAVPIKCKPLLSVGVYGEAKFSISQLAGQTVTAAIPRSDRLWVWTANQIGYVVPTNRLEGFRYHTFRKGIGAVNSKSVIETPYGIFGADRQGMWLLDNFGNLKRLTDHVLDLRAGQDTTLTQSYITEGFLLWVPILNEVWWSLQYDTSLYIQIAYQANRRIFVGPYTHDIQGGTNFVNANGMYAYVTGDKIVDPDTADAVIQYIDFWLGQSAPVTIKEDIKIEVVHSDIPGANIVAKGYQNDIGSTENLQPNQVTYNDISKTIECAGQGRLFKLELILPPELAPVSQIGYVYNAVGLTIKGWGTERAR